MSGALVFIENDTTKKALWVSADNPLPTTGGGATGPGTAAAATRVTFASDAPTLAVADAGLLTVLPDAYETVAASQTAQTLGATGAVGDFLAGILIVPATTSPGAVSIIDGNGSNITIFAGGASSVSNLVPFFVPIQAKCVNATTPGWKVTTGTNVSAVGTGNFT